MDWIAPLLSIIVAALLTWGVYLLARRISILEKAERFTDDVLFSLAEQVIQLEIDLTSVTATKTRAVKKPVAS